MSVTSGAFRTEPILLSEPSLRRILLSWYSLVVGILVDNMIPAGGGDHTVVQNEFCVHKSFLLVL